MIINDINDIYKHGLTHKRIKKINYFTYFILFNLYETQTENKNNFLNIDLTETNKSNVI